MKMHRSYKPRHGFTLVELLVVIGIIALLISILLPSLAKARRSANSIKCMANLRSIVQAMQIYAAQNNGSIPGSPWTTARFVYDQNGIDTQKVVAPYTVNPDSGNYPSVLGVFDWMTPVARIQGYKFTDAEEVANNPARIQRFLKIVNLPIFTCPENDFISPGFASGPAPLAPTTAMVSYCAAGGFLVQHNPTATGSLHSSFTTGSGDANPPKGYNVKVSKVGSSSKKIYVADGGKFSKCNQAPDSSLNFGASVEGSLAADSGAWNGFSNSWDRGAANGNTPASSHGPVTMDARLFGYRHGNQKPFGQTGSYRMNAGFFDGHCESLTDMESANPVFWYPKGSQMNPNAECLLDVKKFYFNGVAPAVYFLKE